MTVVTHTTEYKYITDVLNISIIEYFPVVHRLSIATRDNIVSPGTNSFIVTSNYEDVQG